MKRIGALFLLLVIFSGCADADTELKRGMALRSSLLKAESVSFSLDITADYGDILHTFSMTVLADSQGNVQFQVTAPETISGITGSIREDSGLLTFAETALQFDLMAEDRLSPVAAPWVLLKTLRSGYILSGCQEETLCRLSIDDSYDDDALRLDIWLDGENLPVRGEILYEGRRILTLDVTSFVIS